MAIVTLNASSDYGHTGQYIARITGRAKGVQFAREFVGTKYGKRNEDTSYETDEYGLYEVNHCTRKGKDRRYYLVLPWNEELHKFETDHEDALAIAKRLDDGDAIEQFVVLEREPMTKSVTVRCCATCRLRLEGDTRCAEHPDAAIALESDSVPALNDDGTPKYRLVYEIRKAGEVKKAQAAATLDSAVAAIVAALQALPAAEQKKALAAAKVQLFPKSEGQAAQ